MAHPAAVFPLIFGFLALPDSCETTEYARVRFDPEAARRWRTAEMPSEVEPYLRPLLADLGYT